MEENENTEDHQHKDDPTEEDIGQTLSPASSSNFEVVNERPDHLKEQDSTNTESHLPGMEVHKHPHHVMHKKKWNEYLLEFFMLFLAVFLGFVAENIREHFVEKRQEKEFAFQLTEGLKEDTATLNFILRVDKMQRQAFDSVAFLLSIADDRVKWEGIYRLIENVNGTPLFVSHQASFDQIQNTGGFRYFKNQKIVRALMEYKYWIGLIYYQQSLFIQFSSDKLLPFMLTHFNENKVVQRFKSHIVLKSDSLSSIVPEFASDKNQLMLFQNLIIQGREFLILPGGNFGRLKERADKLIGMLEKEYNFKD